MSRGAAKAGKASAEAVVGQLRALESPKDREGMARFGIRTDRAFGVSIDVLRRMAKGLGTDHELALALWATGYHEARLLASLVDDPARVTEAQADRWAADFDSWDICDICCSNLFDRAPFAYRKAFAWAEDGREFVRRAAITARHRSRSVTTPMSFRSRESCTTGRMPVSDWCMRLAAISAVQDGVQ